MNYKEDKICALLTIIETILLVSVFVSFSLMMYFLVKGEYTLIRIGGTVVLTLLLNLAANITINTIDIRKKEVLSWQQF